MVSFFLVSVLSVVPTVISQENSMPLISAVPYHTLAVTFVTDFSVSFSSSVFKTPSAAVNIIAEGLLNFNK
jgi:hypothetical protein